MFDAVEHSRTHLCDHRGIERLDFEIVEKDGADAREGGGDLNLPVGRHAAIKGELLPAGFGAGEPHAERFAAGAIKSKAPSGEADDRLVRF